MENSDLDSNQKEKFLAFLGKNRNVFVKDLSELGCCKNFYEHKIDTGDAKPIRQRFNRTNPKQRAEIDRQVQEILKNNIIEPSNSEWSSPVVLVKKKCGTFRFTIYFRKVNKVTKPEIFPLPRLDDMLDSIGEANAKYFRLLTWLVHFGKFHLRTVLSQKLHSLHTMV